MHIILLNRWFPPDTGGGGVATHNAFFAAACAKLGHKVTVIASGKQPGMTVNADGVTVHRVPVPVLHKLRRIPVLGRYERTFGMLLYSRQVAALLEPFKKDADTIVEAADINAEAFFWNERKHPRLVIRCHTPTFLLERTQSAASPESDTALLSWAEKRALRKANGWTAPSNDLADTIAKEVGIPRGKIEVIPNAMDADFFHPDAIPRTSTDNARILWVGRLDPGKGLDVLTAALPIIMANAPRARFSFVGGGRRRESGENTLDQLRATFKDEIERGQIDVRGFVPDIDLPACYHESDIAVVPSLIYESFSYTCAQAMACGVPVVASRVGGIPETLANGECGVLVPPNDVDALANAVLGLVHDAERRRAMGAAGRTRAASVFRAEQVARATVAYYEQVLK